MRLGLTKTDARKREPSSYRLSTLGFQLSKSINLHDFYIPIKKWGRTSSFSVAQSADTGDCGKREPCSTVLTPGREDAKAQPISVSQKETKETKIGRNFARNVERPLLNTIQPKDCGIFLHRATVRFDRLRWRATDLSGRDCRSNHDRHYLAQFGRRGIWRRGGGCSTGGNRSLGRRCRGPRRGGRLVVAWGSGGVPTWVP